MALANLPQVFDRLVRFLKRNQVSQSFAAGEDEQRLALIFRRVVTVECFVGNARVPEMEIIQQRELDTGFGDVGSQALLPDSLDATAASITCMVKRASSISTGGGMLFSMAALSCA